MKSVKRTSEEKVIRSLVIVGCIIGCFIWFGMILGVFMLDHQMTKLSQYKWAVDAPSYNGR